jgi:flotillin
VDRHVLEKLAEQQAEAVKGMNPNINIWNTGEPNSKASGALADLLKSGMPLLDGIKQQTGYDFLGSVGVKKD